MKKYFLILVLLAAIILPIYFALAAVSITTATGGGAISADTTGGAYTTLIGPVISEGSMADIGTGTIILNVPSGFIFDTTGIAPTVLVTRISGNGANSRNLNGLASGSTIAVTVTSTTLTITINSPTTNGVKNSLTWQNVRVRPTTGTPLASGNITKTGTSTISGITNSVTNLGTLTEVAGVKNKLVFTTQPSPTATINSDFATKPVVKVQDQFGNIVTSDNTSVINRTAVLSTQTCGGTAGTGTLTSTPANGSTVISGVLTYTAMQYSAAESIKICASSAGITSALSDVIVVEYLTPTITSISPATKYAGDANFILTVNGTNFVSGAVVNFSGSPRTTTYVSATQLTATILASDIATAGNYNITVTNPAPGDITSNSQILTVNPTPATKFVIIDPEDGTVDNAIPVTIHALKADNSLDTNYQSDVTLNVTGSATGGGLVDIINGVGVKNIHDNVAETVNLSLTDSQATGLNVDSTQDVVFSPGVVAKLSLTDLVSVVAGQRVGYTVTRSDQYNNLVTNNNLIVYLYSSSLSPNEKFYNSSVNGDIITSITISSGQSSANFWYYDEYPGTCTITASDNSYEPDGNTNINDAVDSIEVLAGPISKFTLNDPGDVYVSTRLGYTVNRKDNFDNLVASGNNTIYLYSTSPTGVFYGAAVGGNAKTSIDITDSNSGNNFWYYDDTPGTYTITASDNISSPDGLAGIIDATDQVTISNVPIVATRLVILNPADGTVDNPIAVTIQAQDNSGNIDATFQSDVTLETSGSASGGGIVDIVNGVGTTNISNTLAETITLSLLDSQETGLDVSSTQNVVFDVGEVAQFSLNNPGDISAGSRIKYTVTRKDQYGNIVLSGLTKAYLYSLPEKINKKFYDSAIAGSEITFINITNGNSSADFWYYDEGVGVSSIVASDNNTSPDGNTGIDDVSDEISVSAGSVSKFVLDDPGNMNTKTRLGYTIGRQDQFGNPVSSGVSLVYLYSSSTGNNFHFYDSAIGGLVVNSVVIDNGNESTNFWYYDETPGIWVITCSDSSSVPNGNTGIIDATDSVEVSNIPIVATRFVIINPGDSMINTPLDVTIRAEDDEGNVDTTYQDDVTLNLSGSATGAGIVNIVNGVGTVQINDTVEELVTLSLSDTESTGLNVSSSVQINFSTLPPVFVLGGGGGVVVPKVSQVSFSGRAYPGANLSIVAVKEKDQVIKKDSSSPNGTFEIVFTGLSSGARSYALLVQDKDGRTAQTKIYDLNLLDEGSELNVNNIIVSPTVGFPRQTITKGDFLTIVGYAIPKSSIKIEIDGQAINAQLVSEVDGSYKYLFNTALLSLGNHTVRVRQTTPDGLQSEFSPQKVFFTTNLTVPKTDFNNDGKLNISDWSIFLSRWFSADTKVKMQNDLNGDGKLDASDFSIFIRTLRQ